MCCRKSVHSHVVIGGQTATQDLVRSKLCRTKVHMDADGEQPVKARFYPKRDVRLPVGHCNAAKPSLVRAANVQSW